MRAGNKCFTRAGDSVGMQRRDLLAAAALWPAWPLAAGAQTEGDIVWTDAARARSLAVRLRWPAGDAACALVIHSHGLGGSREGGEVWGRAWQAAGLAVLHVQHPGSDTDALRTGRDGLRNAITAEQLIERCADVRFAIDEVERRARAGETPFTRVRIDAVGASGHSFGAQTVQALAGQRFAAAGPALREPRLRAFIAFSPSPSRRGNTPVQEQFGAIERPFLAVTGSLDGDPLAAFARFGGLRQASDMPLTADRRASVYDGLPPGRRALLWLDGADHMSFGGGTGAGRLAMRRGPLAREGDAAEREPAHHALVARLTTAWWRAHLLGDLQAFDALRAPPGLATGDRWRMD